MRRAWLVLMLAVLFGLVTALAGCGGTPTRSGGGAGGGGGGANTIVLQNLSFNPDNLTVKVGDTVTIKNEDQAPHRIVIGTDDLGEQQPGQTTTWTAAKDGVYVMTCTIHPSMQGRITVGAGGSTIGTAPAGGTGGYTPGY